MSKEDNLRPIKPLSHDEAIEQGRRGGIKSGQKRREKKLMTELYINFLEKKHDVINKDGKRDKLSGHEMFNRSFGKIVSRGDSSTVALSKEIREATEGSKVNLDAGVRVVYLDKKDENL
jgi:hypothetical protein